MLTLNSKAKLFLSDHYGTEHYEPEKMEGKIANLDIEPLLKGTNAHDLIVDSPANATHLLVHLSPPERIMAKAGKWPEVINTNQIIFCLTTLDGFDVSEFPHRSDEISGFRRITFFSRVAKPIKNSEAFAEFCELDIAQAESIVEGNTTMLSPSLRQAFSLNPDRYLSALAILCQTYLILYASAAPELTRGSKDILEALDDMGFWIAMGIPLPIDVKQKAEEMTAQWWMETLTSEESGETNEKAGTVAARITREWKGLTGKNSKDKQLSEYGWGDVEALLRVIKLTGNKAEGEVSRDRAVLEPVIVARAYRAIRSVLVV